MWQLQSPFLQGDWRSCIRETLASSGFQRTVTLILRRIFVLASPGAFGLKRKIRFRSSGLFAVLLAEEDRVVHGQGIGVDLEAAIFGSCPDHADRHPDLQ